MQAFRTTLFAATLTALTSFATAGVSLDGASDAAAGGGSPLGMGGDATPHVEPRDSPHGTPFGDDILDDTETDSSSLDASDRGDVNGDGRTDVDDLTELLAQWGTCQSRACRGDLNDDGFVDVDDMIQLLAAWS